MSHTYAVLPVSKSTYEEIYAKLSKAGYGHAFDRNRNGDVIDMHGIALQIDSGHSVAEKGNDAKKGNDDATNR